MKIGVISFTENGKELSLRLKEALESSGIVEVDTGRSGTLEEWTAGQFAAGRPTIFIGACGIAVRAIAPYVKSKLTDIPVLVMDEKGRFVIPILSGHVGGANELAEQIAACMGAVPVITTATDINGCFAVDLFAKENSLTILKKEGIAAVSGKLLSGETVTVSVQGMLTLPVQGMQPDEASLPDGTQPASYLPDRLKRVPNLPDGLKAVPYPPDGPVDIAVSDEDAALSLAACPLKPKEYAVGIGCRKGKEEPELEACFLSQLAGSELSPEDVFAISSIDKKSGEEGICRLAEKYRIPYITFSAKELQNAEGEFKGSAFVEQQMGVDNVCERSALLACGGGGRLILEKQAGDGMTIAIAKKSWSAEDLNWEIR